MAQNLRFMILGDIIGPVGLAMFNEWVPKLTEKYSVDAVILNGENAAKNGKGITLKIANNLKTAGAFVITSGNHIWYNKEIYEFLNKTDFLLRPANYPSDCPGKGYTILNLKGIPVAVLNLQGRGFMKDHIDCPFRKAEALLTYIKSQANIILIDFHAEASAEKQALAHFLDGQISGIYGTHTHVQTSDERILPNGTGYITDLGFSGAINSIIGMQKEGIVRKFLTQMPSRFTIATNAPFELNGIITDIDIQTGKTTKIERLKVIEERQII